MCCSRLSAARTAAMLAALHQQLCHCLHQQGKQLRARRWCSWCSLSCDTARTSHKLLQLLQAFERLRLQLQQQGGCLLAHCNAVGMQHKLLSNQHQLLQGQHATACFNSHPWSGGVLLLLAACTCTCLSRRRRCCPGLVDSSSGGRSLLLRPVVGLCSHSQAPCLLQVP